MSISVVRKCSCVQRKYPVQAVRDTACWIHPLRKINCFRGVRDTAPDTFKIKYCNLDGPYINEGF
jgi:hypothetical protein